MMQNILYVWKLIYIPMLFLNTLGLFLLKVKEEPMYKSEYWTPPIMIVLGYWVYCWAPELLLILFLTALYLLAVFILIDSYYFK